MAKQNKTTQTAPASPATDNQTQTTLTGSRIVGRERITLDLLDSDPENIRHSLQPVIALGRPPAGSTGQPEGGSIEQLADSIQATGNQPRDVIRVRKHPKREGRYMVVDGHRRRLALLTLVSRGVIPSDHVIEVEVREYPDEESVQSEMMVAVFAREDIRPSDKARAIYKSSATNAAIARAIGHTEAYVGGLRRIGEIGARGENGKYALEAWDMQKKGVTYDVLKAQVHPLSDDDFARWVDAVRKGETFKFPRANKTDATGAGDGDPEANAGSGGASKRSDAQKLPKLESALDRKTVEALADERLGLDKEVIGWVTVALAWKHENSKTGVRGKPMDPAVEMRKVSPRKAEKLFGKINANPNS